MGDLYFGLGALALLSAALLAFAFWLGPRIRPSHLQQLLLATISLAVLYALTLWQGPAVASLLPFSNLIVVGNWFPLFAAFAAGLAWHGIPGGAVRRGVPCLLLTATAWLIVVLPLTGETTACGDHWTRDGYCMQTTDETCSAACAASLLRTRNIAASEQEMADLCLTRAGTSWQGLYRGLKLKCQDTPWDVRVIHGNIDQLLAQTESPIIISVGLGKHGDPTGMYRQEEGWLPGRWHSVLLLGETSRGRVRIVDPNPVMCHEQWSREDLALLYRGPAIQLVPRD